MTFGGSNIFEDGMVGGVPTNAMGEPLMKRLPKPDGIIFNRDDRGWELVFHGQVEHRVNEMAGIDKAVASFHEHIFTTSTTDEIRTWLREAPQWP